MKKISMLFLALVASNALWADYVDIDSVSYFYYGDSARVCGNYSESSSITIPSTITVDERTYRVTSIDVQAFYGSDSLVCVTLPNSVKHIDREAFCSCKNLTTVIMGDSVCSIGEQAFCGCISLSSITLPSCLTNLENSAFFGCTSLRSVTIPHSLSYIGKYAFRSCITLKNLIIEEGVKTIGEYAFCECYLLDSVTIPNSVTTIEQHAFAACESLYSIILGNGLTTIGPSALYGCPFSHISIPNSVTRIDDHAFFGNRLVTLTLPSSVTNLGARAFDLSYSLTSIICYAATPPVCENDDTFYYINNSISIYVPESSIQAYTQSTNLGWRKFRYYQAIMADEVMMDSEDVVVQPDSFQTTITWAKNKSATSYLLLIKRNGVVVYSLIFNDKGYFLSPKQTAPARGICPMWVLEDIAGLSYTLTDLNPNTTYTYEIVAKNENDTSLATQSGTFTTTGTLTALESVSFPLGENRGETMKVLKDGQVLIQKDGRSYDITGAEVR